MPDYTPWFTKLSTHPELKDWVNTLQEQSGCWFSSSERGDIGRWEQALAELPPISQPSIDVHEGLLQLSPHTDVLAATLKEFHPWRKGPLQLGNQKINTEWRSDWKWERVAPHIDLTNKRLLDIGCGNGYYLFRMLEQSPEWALGVDPYLPYVMQFRCLQHFAGQHRQIEVFPIGVEHLPKKAPCFDFVFSMGILYHQKSPLEHLMHCRDLTTKGGEVILETIVLPPSYSKSTDCLVPDGRYAKMKNVNFLPSVEMLLGWLRKVQFKSAAVLDYCKTTVDEQRATEWMTFESLPNFLHKDNHDLTIEGYPAPWRVVIKATK